MGRNAIAALSASLIFIACLRSCVALRRVQTRTSPAASTLRLLQAAVDADIRNSSLNSSVPGNGSRSDEQAAAWVTFAVSISDLVSNRQELLGMATNNSMLQTLHEGMERHWATSLTQVNVSSVFSITTGYTFQGIETWDNRTFEALTAAASDMAGGYNSSLINVTSVKPALGVPLATFVNSTPAHVSVKQASSNGSRRLLQQQHHHTDTSIHMKQDVWVSYSSIATHEVKQVLQLLRYSCGSVQLVAGVDLSKAPCGIDTKQLLTAAGLQLSDVYSQSLLQPPVVTLNVQVSIGLTDKQCTDGMDMKIASWLSQPSNIPSALMTRGTTWNIGDPLLQWLHTPEILVVNVLPTTNHQTYNTPGFAVGVAVGGAAVVALAALVMFLVHQRYKQQLKAAKAADGHDQDSTHNSSRRRVRRREGKKRYLLPDATLPSAAAPSTADESTSSIVSAEAVDDRDLLLRPHLTQLGDSVTSAARFEQDSDTSEDQVEAAATQKHRTAVIATTGNSGSSLMTSCMLQQQQQQHLKLLGIGSAAISAIPEHCAITTPQDRLPAAGCGKECAGGSASSAGAPASVPSGASGHQALQHQGRSGTGKASPFANYNFNSVFGRADSLGARWCPHPDADWAEGSSSGTTGHALNSAVLAGSAVAKQPKLLSFGSPALEGAGSTRIAVAGHGVDDNSLEGDTFGASSTNCPLVLSSTLLNLTSFTSSWNPCTSGAINQVTSTHLAEGDSCQAKQQSQQGV